MTLDRNRAILATLLALGIAGAGTAYAGSDTLKDAVNNTLVGTVDDASEAREIAAVMGGKPLASIVADAETRAKARAVEASTEDEDGTALYIVETLRADGTVEELRYRPDGTFVSTAPADAEDAGETAPIVAAKLSLVDGIEAALAESGGTALEAEYEEEDGRLAIEVETVKETVVTEVTVDAATGKVLEVERD